MEEEEEERVTYWKLTCIARVTFAAMASCFMAMVNGVFEPTMSLRLAEFDLSQTYVGMIFAI